MRAKNMISLTITPNQFLVNGTQPVETLKSLNHKRPLHLIFKDWELTIKQLDLGNINIVDRFYAQKEFVRGEFKSRNMILSSESDNHKYRFYGFKDKVRLNSVIAGIVALPNPLYKMEIDEVLWIQKLYALLKPQGWYFLILKEGDTFKILTGHKQNLILVRKNVESIEPELREIKLHLYRFGLNKGDEISIFEEDALVGNFQKDSFLARVLNFIKFKLLERNLSHPKLLPHKFGYWIRQYGLKTTLFLMIIILSMDGFYKNSMPAIKIVQQIDKRYLDLYNTHLANFQIQKHVVQAAKPFLELSQMSLQNNNLEMNFLAKKGQKKEFSKIKKQFELKHQKKYAKMKISGEYPNIKVELK